MLDSNRPMGPGSEQYEWLEKALQHSTARWKSALLDLHDDHLQFRMIDVEGRLRDAFEVRKDAGTGE
jgi:phosphodiesterase/alkaline phosphatase D-like protein